MTNRKTWRIWKILTSNEQGRFILFLKNELGNRQEYLQKLAGFLAQNGGGFPTDADAWSFLYPEKEYEDHRFRKLCRDLTSWLEEFLSIEGFRKNKGSKDLFLLRELADRQAGEDFVKTFNRAEKSWNKAFQKKSLNEQYLLKFQMEVEKQNFVALNRLNPAIIRNFSQKALQDDNENLHDVVRAFIDLIAIQSMIIGMDNSIRLYQGEDSKIRLFQQYLDLLNQATFSTDSFQIKIFKDLTAPSVQSIESYERLFKQLKDHADRFFEEDLQTAITLLINFFSQKLRGSSEEKALEVLLDILIWGISGGVLLSGGFLMSYHYNNLIHLCIRANKFALAGHYIETLKPLLSPREREEAHALGKASLLTAMNKPKELIRFLYDKKFNNPRYEVDARLRILQANYELEPEEDLWLITQISNLQKLIRNKKGLSPYIRKSQLTFLRYFKLMVQAATTAKKEDLKARLMETPHFPNKNWMLQKMALREA